MPTKDKKPHPNDHVYLARRASDGALKIGVAQNVLRRISSLEGENSCKMEFMGAMRGSYDLEASLHERFQHHAIAGKTSKLSEWFHYNEEIVEFARLNMQPAIDFAVQRRLPIQIPVSRKRRVKPGVKVNEWLFKYHIDDLMVAKQEKEGRKISAYIVAKETGITYATVHSLSNGKLTAKLSCAVADKLCRYFKCTVSEYVELVRNPDLPPVQNNTV